MHTALSFFFRSYKFISLQVQLMSYYNLICAISVRCICSFLFCPKFPSSNHIFKALFTPGCSRNAGRNQCSCLHFCKPAKIQDALVVPLFLKGTPNVGSSRTFSMRKTRNAKQAWLMSKIWCMSFFSMRGPFKCMVPLQKHAKKNARKYSINATR